jgi:hypothetical protein
LVSYENDREFIFCPTELFLEFAQSFIIGWIAQIEILNLEGGKHCFERGEVTLENHLTGLAILSIEEIDPKRGGRLGGS